MISKCTDMACCLFRVMFRYEAKYITELHNYRSSEAVD